MGLPLSPKLADAFVFDHLYEELGSGQISQGGEASIDPKWKPAPAPEVWDGPHDDECYRVSFMLRAQPPWKNAVGIDLDRAVQWEPRTAPWLDQRMRYIAYPPSLLQSFPASSSQSETASPFDDDSRCSGGRSRSLIPGSEKPITERLSLSATWWRTVAWATRSRNAAVQLPVGPR